MGGFEMKLVLYTEDLQRGLSASSLQKFENRFSLHEVYGIRVKRFSNDSFLSSRAREFLKSRFEFEEVDADSSE
ncbi:hypothetical protein COV61_02475, partial [Candidatus Micrarchaeota archaeon CG11_big_fil_rev_8_21_14_0_20_47_5]